MKWTEPKGYCSGGGEGCCINDTYILRLWNCDLEDCPECGAEECMFAGGYDEDGEFIMTCEKCGAKATKSYEEDEHGQEKD